MASETAGMKKFWKWAWGGVGAVALIIIGKVVEQFYPTEAVGAFFSFLAGIPAWFIQPVGVPLLVLLGLLIALGASIGYIAWTIVNKRFGEEASKAKLPAPKPELIVGDEPRRVLKVIADATNAGTSLTVKRILDFAGMDQVNFNHALYELENNSLIRTYASYQKGKMVQLTPTGTKYVIDHDLAHKRVVGQFGGQRPR
jgi:predicted transcriptional regulator